MKHEPSSRTASPGLCPGCGAPRVHVQAEVAADLELARDPRMDLLTVVAAHVRDGGFDDAAIAWCTACGWRGIVAELQSVPT
ncbi:MAG: hypothetical protein ABR510_07145 [Trueperaceae bacterium]